MVSFTKLTYIFHFIFQNLSMIASPELTVYFLYSDENQETHEHSSDNKLDLGIIVSEDKRIYENRISELVADRLMADSKATNFYLECMALQKRIKFRENNKVRNVILIGDW